jgi:MFS family permease
LLVLAVFSAFVVTVSDSAHALHAGVAGETSALSGMSLGLATALLTAGALADDVGRGRVLEWSAGLLAMVSVVGALAPTMAVLVAARCCRASSVAAWWPRASARSAAHFPPAMRGHATRRTLDLPGVATLVAGMALLTAALVEGRQDWSSTTTIALFVLAAVLLGAFAVVEVNRRRPMLDPRLFTEP